MDSEASQVAARNFIVANTFVGCLPDDVISKLMSAGRQIELVKGDCLFERGDPVDSLLVILSGTLKISSIDHEGRETVLNFLKTGDVIGEIAALDGGERTATAVALEACELFALQREDLIPILRGHTDALFEIIDVLCEKLRCTSDMIEAQTYSMPVKFAIGLRRLAYLHGRRSASGIAIDLTASQTDLGSYLGLSRANTSRQISRMRSEGILDLDGGTLTIIDDTALRRIAETIEP